MGPGLLRFAPVVDGKLITTDPYGNKAGSYHDTPVLAGMNANESFSLPENTLAGVQEDIKTLFGIAAPKPKLFISPRSQKIIELLINKYAVSEVRPRP